MVYVPMPELNITPPPPPTVCPLPSQLQHIYLGQPYARVYLHPICQSRLYPPVRDFGFGLCISTYAAHSQYQNRKKTSYDNLRLC